MPGENKFRFGDGGKWYKANDSLFGPYRVRHYDQYKGSCFDCGGKIDGPAAEKERGGTIWQVHRECWAKTVP